MIVMLPTVFDYLVNPLRPQDLHVSVVHLIVRAVSHGLKEGDRLSPEIAQ